jgi:protein-arginine kinase activator protein McsA
MNNNLENLEVLWETYDFHTGQITTFESVIEEDLSHLKHFLNENLNPTQQQKSEVKGVISHDCSQCLMSYKKQIHVIEELIEAYQYFSDNGVSVPESREVRISYLEELRDSTTELMEGISDYKAQVQEMLH